MYRPIILPHFKKQLKRHSRKYRHLKGAVISILESFDKRQHIHIGRNVYKVRLKTKDIARGKSKSFRMLVFLIAEIRSSHASAKASAIEADKYLVPVCIYFKGDREDITKKEINDHLEIILFELRMENLVK